MLQRVSENDLLDAEYRHLWFALYEIKEEDPRYDEMFNRLCEIEDQRNYKQEELRELRRKE